jgi:hypothetical protein
LGSASLVSLTVCAVTSWLYARAKVNAKDADSARNEANQNLKDLAAEFNQYRYGREAQLHVLRGKIKELEDALLKSNTPGARRQLVNSLLQAAGSQGGDGNESVPPDPSPAKAKR